MAESNLNYPTLHDVHQEKRLRQCDHAFSWWTVSHQTMSVTTGAIFVVALLVVLTTNSIIHFVVSYVNEAPHIKM